MKDEHIVVHQEGLVIECINCGTKDAMELPAAIEIWLAMARAFRAIHKDCNPKENHE